MKKKETNITIVLETLAMLKKVLIAEFENDINEAFWSECKIFDNFRLMTKEQLFVYRTLANEMNAEWQKSLEFKNLN